MPRRIAVVVACIVLLGVAPARALYSVSDRGVWPKTWPKELEQFRKSALTYSGPHFDYQHHAIRFTDRAAFERTWPHILAVRTPGVPIVLRRAPNFFLGKASAGVCIHTPPPGTKPVADVESYRLKSIYIELVVDGDVVDLNRIPLPPGTPIIDERFEQPAE